MIKVLPKDKQMNSIVCAARSDHNSVLYLSMGLIVRTPGVDYIVARKEDFLRVPKRRTRVSAPL